MYQYGSHDEEAPKDKIFEAESKVIKELAAKGKCVIIGRCSDYVCRDDENVLKIFLTAPLESRIKRVAQRLNITVKRQSLEFVMKTRGEPITIITIQVECGVCG